MAHLLKILFSILLIFPVYVQAAEDGLLASFDFKNNLTSDNGEFVGEEIGSIGFGPDRFGALDSALYLDGSGNVITDLNMTDYFSVGDEITISAWFKTSQSNFRSAIVAGARPGGGPDFVVLLEFGKIVARLYGGSNSISDETLNDNEWHHVVWGYDPDDGGYFYIDGELQDQAPIPGLFSRDFLSFGAVRESQNRFIGYIDDVFVYKKSLTPEEVNNLFMNTPGSELSNLKQLRADGKTVVGQGQTVVGNALVFSAEIENGEDGKEYALQVEVERVEEDFDGEDVFESTMTDGSTVSTKVRDFIKNQDLYGGNNRGDFKWRARVIDEDGDESPWVEYGEDGVDFTLRAVPLFTQQASPYPNIEDTTSWEGKQYGFGRSPECKNTIKGCGCVLSALTTLASYYGITTGVDGSEVSPDKLNTWLRNNNGYDNADNLKFNEAIKYFGRRVGNSFQSQFKVKSYAETSTNVIRDFVSENGPTLANAVVPGLTHFFVLDSLLNEGYEVSDPFWYNTDTSNDVRDAATQVQDYNDTIKSARLITWSEETQIVGRSLQIHLASPASILVTDALGRKLGYDPRTDMMYKEIPTGEYWIEPDISTEETEGPVHENKNATVLEPTASPYTVEIIGEDEGEYYVSMYTNNTNGSSSIRDFSSSTAPGVVHVYRAYFNDDALNAELTLLQEFIDWLKSNGVPKGMQKSVGAFVTALEPQVEAGTVVLSPSQYGLLREWKQRQTPAQGYEKIQKILKSFGY